MAMTNDFKDGGYRYIPAVFQYSGGVAAMPGFEIHRAKFRRLIPLEAGFKAVAAHLQSIGRPLTAFCACELRSPAPFDEAGFAAFNRTYVGTLEQWGLYRDGVNSVSRSNVCPELNKPASPSFYAFAYTMPTTTAPPASFIVAGSAETPEGTSSYRDHAVRLGDGSAEALREKARWVLTEMERRMTALEFTWRDITAAHAYTVRDFHPFVAEELVRRGAMPFGLTWHFARPPIVGLEYEMDVRGVPHELILPASVP